MDNQSQAHETMSLPKDDESEIEQQRLGGINVSEIWTRSTSLLFSEDDCEASSA